MTSRTWPVLVALSILGAGCYTTTLRSGAVAAPASVAYDGKWHHGLLWGLVELSGPYDLQKICPQGWAEITTETTFLTGLVSAITYSIYAPQSVTIRCAEVVVVPNVAPRAVPTAPPDSKPGAPGSGAAMPVLPTE